ncbi:hypothetical protein AVEN_97987-1 [Araneus ventricosus]|uniref:Uncharacterized protein n=1 Tax=Araneus ventricosus TaxID=182803 RepID=A0A4Y2IW99_ARAVE|nr:hypothetical protein AVEN_97987-1 [Araneus ventricosus]
MTYQARSDDTCDLCTYQHSSSVLPTYFQFCSDFPPTSGEIAEQNIANYLSGIGAWREIRVHHPTAINILHTANRFSDILSQITCPTQMGRMHQALVSKVIELYFENELC